MLVVYLFTLVNLRFYIEKIASNGKKNKSGN